MALFSKRDNEDKLLDIYALLTHASEYLTLREALVENFEEVARRMPWLERAELEYICSALARYASTLVVAAKLQVGALPEVSNRYFRNLAISQQKIGRLLSGLFGEEASRIEAAVNAFGKDADAGNVPTIAMVLREVVSETKSRATGRA